MMVSMMDVHYLEPLSKHYFLFLCAGTVHDQSHSGDSEKSLACPPHLHLLWAGLLFRLPAPHFTIRGSYEHESSFYIMLFRCMWLINMWLLLVINTYLISGHTFGCMYHFDYDKIFIPLNLVV